jgi:hypothetical protein
MLRTLPAHVHLVVAGGEVVDPLALLRHRADHHKLLRRLVVHLQPEAVFLKFYGAQESIPINRFRQPM